MRSKKAAQGLSEEKAFVCLALAVHKASERILLKDHQLLLFYFEIQVPEKWYGNVIMNDYIQMGLRLHVTTL